MFTVLYWLYKSRISGVELWCLFWIISIVFYFVLSYFLKRKMRSTLKDFLIVEFCLDLMWAILLMLNDSFIIECGTAMRYGMLGWMFCAWIFLLAEKVAASKIKIRIAMYSFLFFTAIGVMIYNAYTEKQMNYISSIIAVCGTCMVLIREIYWARKNNDGRR